MIKYLVVDRNQTIKFFQLTDWKKLEVKLCQIQDKEMVGFTPMIYSPRDCEWKFRRGVFIETGLFKRLILPHVLKLLSKDQESAVLDKSA